MAYEYEHDVISELEQMGVDYESNGYFNMSIEVEEVYRKAQAFDNYIVDMVKSIETYPRDYSKNEDFAKETYDFYMQSKEEFIDAYKNEVRRGHELIESVEEYDRIINELERADDER